MYDPGELDKIIDEVCKQLNLDSEDLKLEIPKELETLHEAVDKAKRLLFKESATDLHNKVNAALSISESLFAEKDVSPHLIDVSVESLEQAIEILKKIKSQLSQ